MAPFSALHAVSTAMLQAPPNVNVDPTTGVASGTISAFLTTLIVGRIRVTPRR
jgi:hypothetical protein